VTPDEPVTRREILQVEEHLKELITALDQRYEQRFNDSQTAVLAALSAARTAVDAALSAAKEAVAKAEGASDKRFDGVDEFKNALSDQQRTLMPRSEQETINKGISDKITALEGRFTEQGGQKAGNKETLAYVIAALSLTISFVEAAVLLLRK
jgi:hypothetical protein